MRLAKLFILIVILLVNTSCFIQKGEVDPDGVNFYTLNHPYERFQDPDTFFKKEYNQINKRRNNINVFERPSSLVGLSLSGGGIRSGAFQLGLLSGLHSIKYNGGSTLKRMDYISSVSGGAWANGAYWAWDKTDDELFSCLDLAAENGSNYAIANGCSENTVSMLRHYQGIGIIPYDAEEGWFKQRKEIWESDIEKYYLSPDRNVDLSAFNWEGHFAGKPYPIISSTHDAMTRFGKSINLPFETTPDYLGTIIDLNSKDVDGNTFCSKSLEKAIGDKRLMREINEECKKSKMGFFVIQNSDEFSWWNRKWYRYWKFWELNPDEPGATLSKVLAHSSGVVGKDLQFLLAYNFDLRFQGKYVSNLRKYYQLVDGGKSDNLGVIPLVERQIDLIIVSYMGKDREPFEDYKLANEQVEKLFDCKFNMDIEKKNIVMESSYSCPDNRSGLMILIKPTYSNVEKFKQSLKDGLVCRENSKCIEVFDYLTSDAENRLEESDRFPQSKTFDFSYDEKLIRAYYLLGRYIARAELNEKLSQHLKLLDE